MSIAHMHALETKNMNQKKTCYEAKVEPSLFLCLQHHFAIRKGKKKKILCKRWLFFLIMEKQE